MKFLGNSCWKITNGPYYDRLELFICGKNGGEYDFGDGSGVKCAELIDGHVLTSTHKSDFYTDEDTYELYGYDGKKVSTSFSQDELEKIFKSDVKDFGLHVMMWEAVPEESTTNHWFFVTIQNNKKIVYLHKRNFEISNSRHADENSTSWSLSMRYRVTKNAS